MVERKECKHGCTQINVAQEFVLKKDGSKWIEIDQTPVVFPIYKFSDNPDSLDKLDFSKLVRLENKANETWQKYLVFDAEQLRITQSNAVMFGSDNKSIQNFETIDEAKKISLKIDLLMSDSKYYEFYYKIINFLTPSFKLEEAIKQQ